MRVWQTAPAAGDAVPCFGVALGVPTHGGDSVAGFYAVSDEGLCDAAGAEVDVGPGSGGDGAFGGSGDDFASGVASAGVVEDGVDVEGPVLHVSRTWDCSCGRGWGG